MFAPLDFRKWAVVLEDQDPELPPTYGRAVHPVVVWPWQELYCESCCGRRRLLPVLLYGTQCYRDKGLTVREHQTGGDIAECGSCLRQEYRQNPALWYRVSRKDMTTTHVGGS